MSPAVVSGEELITFLASMGLLAGAAQGPAVGLQAGVGAGHAGVLGGCGLAWEGAWSRAGLAKDAGALPPAARQLTTPAFPRTLAPALTSAEGVALHKRVLYCPLEVFRDWRGRGEGRRAPQPVFRDLWPPSPFPMGTPGAVHTGVLTSGPWPP